MSPPPHVTVVVPVLNRRERVLRCLEAILAQDYPSFDVLILDNGSSDGTFEACLARVSELPEDKLDVRRAAGLVGAVRNTGTRIARGEIVAFTDSDCLPLPGWLDAGVRAFQREPRVGVVTGPTLPEAEPGRWAATQEISAQTWRFEACNVMFRRAALAGAAGFDETRTMWEDTAAGWSVLRDGWHAAFAPGAVVRHDVTYPGWTWHLRRVQRYGEGAAVARRYPEAAERLFWHRYFLRARNARVVLAVTGVALSPLHRSFLVLVAPYAWFRRPLRATPRALLDSAQLTVFDLAVLVGMVRGSAQARRLLL